MQCTYFYPVLLNSMTSTIKPELIFILRSKSFKTVSIIIRLKAHRSYIGVVCFLSQMFDAELRHIEIETKASDYVDALAFVVTVWHWAPRYRTEIKASEYVDALAFVAIVQYWPIPHKLM